MELYSPPSKKAKISNLSSDQSLAIQGEAKEIVVFGPEVMNAKSVKVEMHLTQNMPGYKKPEPEAKVLFQVRDPTDTFIGRKEFLKKLHDIIQQCRNKERKITILSQTSSVTGLGGIGKSETVRMYIQEYVDEYDNIVWIDAENSSDTRAQFLILAGQELKIKLKDCDNQPIKFSLIRDKVYEKLCQKPKRLLIIFDNAEDLDSTDGGIRPFLPAHTRVIEPPIVLVTSRQRKWEGANWIALDLWEIDECIEYIYMRLNLEETPENRDNATKLAALFDRLTIAIELAVSMIAELSEENRVCGNDDYGIKDFITEYDADDDDNALKEQSQLISIRIQLTIQKLLNVSLQKIEKNAKGKVALKILAFMAYLSPTKIPTMMIRWLLEQHNQQNELGSSLLLLTRYSIIQSFGTYLTIHRVFQDVIIMNLRNVNLPEPNYIPEFPVPEDEMKILTELTNTITPRIAKEDSKKECNNDATANLIHVAEYIVKQSMITHSQFYSYVEAVAVFVQSTSTQYEVAIKLYMKLIECDIKILKPEPRLIFRKLSAIASIYYSNSKIQNAFDTYKALLHGGEVPNQRKFKCTFVIEQGIIKTFGSSHSDTLRTQNNFATCLRNQGKNEEALKRYYAVLRCQEKKFGVLHPDILDTKHNIAIVLSHQGKKEEALKLYYAVLKAREELLVDHDPNTLSTRHNIALIFSEQGKKEEALIHYNAVLQAREKVLGALHSDTLGTRNNIAGILSEQGKTEEALNLYNDVLEAQKKVQGNLHADTLSTKHNIANCLSHQGKTEEALNLFYDVLQSQEQELGADHPLTIRTKLNIARSLDKQGKFEDALKYYYAVIQDQDNVFGELDPLSWGTKYKIADRLSLERKTEDALALYNDVLAAQEKILGGLHPDTLSTKLRIANRLKERRKYEDALKFYYFVLEAREKELDGLHPDILSIKKSIAICLNKQGKTEEALTLFNFGLKALENEFGALHPDTWNTKHSIANCLINQGKTEAALKLYYEVLNAQEKELGALHQDTLCTKQSIANCLRLQGKVDEGLKLSYDVLNARKNALGPLHPDTLIAEHSVANCLSSQGKIEESLKLYSEVLTAQEEVLGDEHPDTLNTKLNIANQLIVSEQGKIEEALELVYNVLETRKKALGAFHPDTLIVKHILANHLTTQGKAEEAFGFYSDVIDARTKILGAVHPLTLLATLDISKCLEDLCKIDE